MSVKPVWHIMFKFLSWRQNDHSSVTLPLPAYRHHRCHCQREAGHTAPWTYGPTAINAIENSTNSWNNQRTNLLTLNSVILQCISYPWTCNMTLIVINAKKIHRTRSRQWHTAPSSLNWYILILFIFRRPFSMKTVKTQWSFAIPWKSTSWESKCNSYINSKSDGAVCPWGRMSGVQRSDRG